MKTKQGMIWLATILGAIFPSEITSAGMVHVGSVKKYDFRKWS